MTIYVKLLRGNGVVTAERSIRATSAKFQPTRSWVRRTNQDGNRSKIEPSGDIWKDVVGM